MKERPGKTLLLIVGLMIAVATVVSLYSTTKAMHVDLQDKVDEYGANMVIVPKSESLPLTYAGVTIGGLQYDSSRLTEADMAKIRTIEDSANIRVVAPKLLGIVPVDGEKSMIAGINFRDEFSLKKWWEVKKGERPSKSNEVLLGGKAASQLGLNAGDRVDIGGKTLTVTGILSQVGTQEDELVYIDFKQAQTILKKPGEISVIEVAAWCKDCPIDDIVEQVSWKLPGAKVSAVRQAAETRDAVIGQFSLFSAILSVTMLVVAALIVFTNGLSTVRERRREIGIFRAVGYRKSHILFIILLESAIVGLVAGVAGYLIGFFGAMQTAPLATGIDVGISYEPVLLVLATVGVATLSLAASIYPALSAARLDPAEALHSL